MEFYYPGNFITASDTPNYFFDVSNQLPKCDCKISINTHPIMDNNAEWTRNSQG